MLFKPHISYEEFLRLVACFKDTSNPIRQLWESP